MTVPWPDDDARKALSRYGELLQVIRGDPKLRLVERAGDIRACKDSGVVGLIFGSQSAGFLEELAMVEPFQRIGVRVVQLTYNERNTVGDGCLESANAGLSDYGRQLVRELNRAGILIDLSHVGERTSMDAMERSDRPCLISHSNPRRRAENPRNVTDEQIRLCADRGGVVGLTPYAPICWTGTEEPPTLQDLVGHIEYVAELAGVDHIAIGTDSEATPGAYPPELSASLVANYPGIMGAYRERFGAARTVGFESMENWVDLVYALLNRGWTEADLRKLLGENLMRVYAKSWGYS